MSNILLLWVVFGSVVSWGRDLGPNVGVSSVSEQDALVCECGEQRGQLPS